MSNVAVIFAGGTGQRMNTKTKPKQFLELYGKPILVYTLEQFQQHKEIDGIVLVMLEGWLDYSRELIEKYRLSKVKTIVAGGATGQESIYNGLCAVSEFYKNNPIVLIHDGVRPLIDSVTISRNIACVRENGTAITVAPAIETITLKDDKNVIEQILERSRCLVAKAPQSFYLNDIIGAHKSARADESLQFIDSASLMQYYGHVLYTVEDGFENIKITTPSDFYIFRAIVDAKEDTQLLGL